MPSITSTVGNLLVEGPIVAAEVTYSEAEERTLKIAARMLRRIAAVDWQRREIRC